MRSLKGLALAASLLAPVASANVVGGDLQNFNAVPEGIDFVTVQSSETLEPGFFNVSLMLNFQGRQRNRRVEVMVVRRQ